MECTVYSTPVGVIKQSPNLLNSLSKLSNIDKNNAHLLRCYMEPPSLIRGKTFIEPDSEKRNKAKYHNTYSLSQSSKHNSINVSASTESSRYMHTKRKHDLKLPLKDDSPVSGSMDSWRSRLGRTRLGGNFTPRTDSNYRYPFPDNSNSNNSVKSMWTVQEYSNEYFDVLDLPGHFNTRGIYGQKADVSPFTLKRTNSELSLSNINSRLAPLDRQNTDLMWKMRSTEKTDYLLRDSKNIQLPIHKQNKTIDVQIKPARGQTLQQFMDTKKIKRLRKNILPDKTQKLISSMDNDKHGTLNNIRNKENKMVSNVNLMADEMLDGIGALKVNEQLKYLKPKRNSVDASVQTDGEFTDAARDYFLS